MDRSGDLRSRSGPSAAPFSASSLGCERPPCQKAGLTALKGVRLDPFGMQKQTCILCFKLQWDGMLCHAGVYRRSDPSACPFFASSLGCRRSQCRKAGIVARRATGSLGIQEWTRMSGFVVLQGPTWLFTRQSLQQSWG